ncbi:MAG: PilZ domain-containing protein [Deltaproteobacteria bacterium]|nr:PilZ domain-containing protein [Deltaproteobacteria bacterium]
MDLEKIQGKQLLKLFEDLEKDRTVMNLHLLGVDYERLTIVTGRVSKQKTDYFLIDYPRGFKEAVEDGKNTRLLFQFVASDKIQYRFRSTFTKITRKDVWITFPDAVERIQRRKSFRMAPPLGTVLFFHKEGHLFESSVVNISEGGVLLTHNGRFHKGFNLFKDESISNLHLKCNEKSLKLELDIDKAVILRVEKRTDVNRLTYALRFVHMNNRAKNELSDWIYRCQREFIRRENL